MQLLKDKLILRPTNDQNHLKYPTKKSVKLQSCLCVVLHCGTTVLQLLRRGGGSCGSGVEPAYCYHKIGGSIPLVCMSKGNILTPKHFLMLHCSHRHQCMNLWITVSCFGQKCLINAIKCKCKNCLKYLSLDSVRFCQPAGQQVRSSSRHIRKYLFKCFWTQFSYPGHPGLMMSSLK